MLGCQYAGDRDDSGVGGQLQAKTLVDIVQLASVSCNIYKYRLSLLQYFYTNCNVLVLAFVVLGLIVG